MNQFAADYEILRGVSPTSLTPCKVQPARKPMRVAFLLNEKRFLEADGLMSHNETVFYEDSQHDWNYRPEAGGFFYYGHAMGLEEVGDILVVYELSDKPAQPRSR